MRRWIALAAKLYPRAWRARYGEEFDAMLEDANADWRQLFDVTRGALTMQLTNYRTHLILTGGLAMAGAILATAVSFAIPPRYVSSAVVQVVPVVDPGQPAPPEVLHRAAEDWMQQLQLMVAGRDNVLRVIQEPQLDLYRSESEQIAWEDVAEQIHDNRDLEIRPIGDGTAVRISFAYRDREKARAALREFLASLVQWNETLNKEVAENWRVRWSQPIPLHERVDLVDPAALPAESALARRGIFAACGIAAGLLLATLAIFFWRLPRFALRVLACGLAGCALGFGLSFLTSEQYTSRAVLRIYSPLDPARLSGAEPTIPAREWVSRLREELLGGDKVIRLLQMKKLGFDGAAIASLYRNREQVFGFRLLYPNENETGTAFEVAFSGPDPEKVRAVVRELTSEASTRIEQDQEGSSSIDKVAVANSPTIADETTTHYQRDLMIAGAAMGILLAVARWSGSAFRGSGSAYRTTSINGESSVSL